jgi:hypothetical protein
MSNQQQQQHKQRIPKLTKKARTGRLDPSSLAAALRWNQVAERMTDQASVTAAESPQPGQSQQTGQTADKPEAEKEA